MKHTTAIYRPESNNYVDVVIISGELPEKYTKYYAQQSQKILFDGNLYSVSHQIGLQEKQEYVAFFDRTQMGGYRLAALGIMDTSANLSIPA